MAHLGPLLLLDCKIEPSFMKLYKCYKEGKTLCSPCEIPWCRPGQYTDVI